MRCTPFLLIPFLILQSCAVRRESDRKALSLKEFKERFFLEYVKFEPEEGTILGTPLGDGRLRDMSVDGLNQRSQFFRRTLEGLKDYPSEDLDLKVIRTIAEYELRSYSRGDHLSNIEWSYYPYHMIAHQVAQGLDPKPRASQVERFLKDHEKNLLQGIRTGKVPYRGLVDYMANYRLPAVVDFMAKVDLKAMAAYVRHIDFLKREVLYLASESYVLGPEEYDWRLKHTLMVKTPLKNILDNARSYLERSRPALVQLSGTSNLRDATSWVQRLQQEVDASPESVHQRYNLALHRALNFVSGRGLFHLPKDFSITVVNHPVGERLSGPGGNWPAPLLDEAGKGMIVLNPSPSVHSKAWRKVFSIHEGVPGHYLQSRLWKDQFRGSTAPVRFLLSSEEVALPRNYFGTLMNTEGWAAYAEDLMLKHNYYKLAIDKLFALTSHRTRAARALVDAGIHTGTMTEKEARKLLEDELGLPPEKARLELERYKLAPLQAMAHYLGFQQILRVKKGYFRRKPKATEADFHSWFLSFGPLWPSLIEEELKRSI